MVMHYYEVWVAHHTYHTAKALTYASKEKLENGRVVMVQLKSEKAPAVISRGVTKPRFAVKEVARVIGTKPLPPTLLKLIFWLQQYYPASFGQTMSLILPRALVQQSRSNEAAPALEQTKPLSLPPLTPEQEAALSHFKPTKPTTALLHGATGSGKTRVYVERIASTLASGRCCIVLTPEIGLTPQLAMTISASFPSQVVLMHSELTPAARRKAWLALLDATSPQIIIGPRSALFAPVYNLGLIVVDEFHENTYKQDQAPYYLTTRVAATLAKFHKADLILGSATPPIQDYYAFEQKKLPILTMHNTARNLSEPAATPVLIDLRKRENLSRSPWLANDLIEAIEQALQYGQQSLIFLNRRGTARAVLCKNCGWQAVCSHCDLPLTYHADLHTMRCHTCGYSGQPPTSCPECRFNDIIFKSVGTKALSEELAKLFPQARVGRFDSDTKKDERLEHHYEAIKQGAVDILVGTQTLAKGLDLPKLTVVGIALADTSLSFPDYTAEERTYQLITQALGRINRGHLAGKAYIQSYQPDSPVLAAAIKQDYQSFYATQLLERHTYHFPPFCHILKLSCARKTASAAQKSSLQLAKKLHSTYPTVEVIGPSPAFIEKARGLYHWQIIVKANQRQLLTTIVGNLPSQWQHDLDPTNLL